MKLGAYTLIRKIAVGGIAEIYLAKGVSLCGEEKYLVCKCIKPELSGDSEFIESIIREARLSVRMRHPNIMEIFDLCYSDNRAYLTMEYMDAPDILHLMCLAREKGLKMPYGVAIHVICASARGLHYAHELCDEQGEALRLVHRDISPENILLGSDGSIKIGDFGIAKTCQMPDITPPETIKGKFGYMSPEQAWGDKVDRRSDIFSLAIVLYELTTGYSFYGQDAISDKLLAARVAQYTPPGQYAPDYPKDLEAILAKALDLDKGERYQTADAFREALETCAEANGWGCDRRAWLEWLHTVVDAPCQGLSRMHADDIPKDPHSIVSNKQKMPFSPDGGDADRLGSAVSSRQGVMQQLATGEIPPSGTLPAVHQSLIMACIPTESKEDVDTQSPEASAGLLPEPLNASAREDVAECVHPSEVLQHIIRFRHTIYGVLLFVIVVLVLCLIFL